MNYNLNLEKITASQTFANKEVLKGLLKFLYEESQKDRNLRETDIAIDYFKRGSEFVSGEDTIVRVAIYKLRALLDKYYAEEGKDEVLIIEIPKGSYSLKIRKRLSSENTSKIKWVKLLYIILFISVLLNIFLFFFYNTKKEEQINPVWTSYVKTGQPVHITLGDPFFYRIKDTSTSHGSLIIRDITINSKEELELIKPGGLQESKSEISKLDFTYYSRNNLWPLPGLISYFAKSSVETRLHTLSETNIDDIKNNNVVFIANINSFGWMNKLLEKSSSISLYNNPREIRIKQEKENLVLKVPEIVKGSYVDYAIMVKVPGPNNNLITMMGDFHASGLKGLTAFINKQQNFQELENYARKKYGYFPEYFEMVVKVTSFNYADFDTKVIYFKSLD